MGVAFSTCLRNKDRSEVLTIMIMALLAYFKKSNPSKAILPSPIGPLSLQMPSSCIEAANKRVTEELERASASESARKSTKRGMYQKYTPKEKAEISSYAAMHGTTATTRHFKDHFPQLKWTVNDWKKAMVVATKKAAKSGNPMQIDGLEEKKRGRPSILSEDVTSDVKHYITTLRDAGGVVNTQIVIAAATGILQRKYPSILCCNGSNQAAYVPCSSMRHPLFPVSSHRESPILLALNLENISCSPQTVAEIFPPFLKKTKHIELIFLGKCPTILSSSPCSCKTLTANGSLPLVSSWEQGIVSPM